MGLVLLGSILRVAGRFGSLMEVWGFGLPSRFPSGDFQENRIVRMVECDTGAVCLHSLHSF